MFYSVVCALAITTVVWAAPTPPSGFEHHMNVVADTYDLYWSVKDREIHFEVQVKTLGYVGFGISRTGGMIGSDIVTMWVKDDLVYFQDRHATRNGEPPIDPEQNWFVIEGRETDGYTIVRFKRPLISCDKEHDMDITDETMKLIYAFHEREPEDAASIFYHGTENRGTKSVFLIGIVEDQMPKYSGYFEFLNPNYTVPAKETTYWCEVFKMPKLDEKNQIVRIEPIVQPGNEGMVHHVLIYACYHEFNESDYEDMRGECYQNLMGEVDLCTAVIAAWAIGGKAINYPDHVGFPIGKDHPPTMIRMETHYDNPSPSKSGIVDASGLRFYYSDTLREYDAGVLEVGSQSDHSLVVPPKFDSLLSRFFCTQECLSAAIPENEDLKVFGLILHSHLMGTQITVRHFRDGKELPPIAKDRYYDFNYQDFKMLPEEVIVKPNDHLIVECDYDSAERTNVTYGGLPTTEEMCLAYIWHYPKRDFSRCLGNPVPYQYLQFIDPTIEGDDNGVGFRHKYFHFNVTTPEEFAYKGYREILGSVDWNDPAWRQKYHDNIMKTDTPIFLICNNGYTESLIEFPTVVKTPKIENEYVSPPVECYDMSSDGHIIRASILLSFVLTICVLIN